MDPGSIPALAGAPLFLQRSPASARVRAMAAERFGAWAHSHPDAATALKAATTGAPYQRCVRRRRVMRPAA
jgi:hypothetical protein